MYYVGAYIVLHIYIFCFIKVKSRKQHEKTNIELMFDLTDNNNIHIIQLLRTTTTPQPSSY